LYGAGQPDHQDADGKFRVGCFVHDIEEVYDHGVYVRGLGASDRVESHLVLQVFYILPI
jgi:hypothetical protein